MRDQFGRTVNYMRISITDRCNLRCRYCMPEGIVPVAHRDILTYEEILQAAGAAVELGVTKFKVTGGEPLVRLGCVDFLARLKALPGVEAVTLTTNGVLIDDEVIDFANREMDNVVLSLDGRKEIHDRLRVDYAGRGSYDRIVPKFQKLVAGRGTKDYYVRGTFTRDNLDFAMDVLHMGDLGFRHVSVEPAADRRMIPLPSGRRIWAG